MFLTRLLPWWLFLLFALLFGALAVSFWRDYLVDRGDLATAIANPPETIVLDNLMEQTFASSIREFAVRDIAGTSVGVFEGASTGRAFLMLESTSTPPIYLAFTDTSFAEDRFAEIAEAIQADWEGYVIRGVLTDSTLDQERLSVYLISEGYPLVGRTILMADLLEGDRENALSGLVQEGLAVVFIGGVVAAVFALIALIKFRKWRGRRAVKRAAKQAAKQAAVPADPYASSPIQSRGRKG